MHFLNWWIEMGLLTLIFVMVKAYVNPKSSDWSRMPNPFSPEFQMLAALSFVGYIVFWPFILFYMAVEK